MKRVVSFLLAFVLIAGQLMVPASARTLQSAPFENEVSADWNAIQPDMSGVMAIDVGDNIISEGEPNDYGDQATLLQNDYTVYGSVSATDLVDWYYINLAEECTVVIATAATSADFVMGWYNPDDGYVYCGEYLGYDAESGMHSWGFGATFGAGTYHFAAYDDLDQEAYYGFYIAIQPTHEHTYEGVVTTPSCDATGFTTYTCTGCGDSYVSDYVNPLPHTMVTEPGYPATCTEPGLTDKEYCSVCGGVFKAPQTIPAAHTYGDGVVTAPSCSAEGYTTYTCTVCGEAKTDNVTEKLPHTPAVDAAVAPSCTEPGKTEGSHCSVCDEVLLAQTDVSATGHKDENQDFVCDTCKAELCTEHEEETVAAVDPTCTETGLTEGKRCAICGVVLEEQEVVEALGHLYSDGLDGTCDRCGIDRATVEYREVVHMFRLYNPNTGEHFYTGSEEERENLTALGWRYEGIGFSFPANTGLPVHRLFHEPTGEHLYTMDEAERARLEAEGWNYEGVAFNSAYDTEAVQYRLHNPNETCGAYHFTNSEEEKQNLLNEGWEDQGIGWYSCFKQK